MGARRDKRAYLREEARVARHASRGRSQRRGEHCEEHEVHHVHHYHGKTETAYVKKNYWVKEPKVVNVEKVVRHVHLASYKGASESASKLETLQKIAMAASAAYRKHVDEINVSNEKRYATYVKKIATSRGAAMKRREERLVIIAKKIAAIRAEYFRQLHAAQAAYDKSRVVENFNKKLDTCRHKVMNKKDE